MDQGRKVFNAYGPTETTVGPAFHRVDRTRNAAGYVPIGRPIANMEVGVYDRSLQPIPTGVAGELCVAGVGLARDYLNRPPDRIPSVFVPLARLPLNANGKIARSSLPTSPSATLDTAREFVAPRTPIEQVLAGVWQEVLHVPRVHHNFFYIGGHSLLAMRTIAPLRTALGIEESLRTFFDNSTMAGLGEVIAARQKIDEAHQPPCGLPARKRISFEYPTGQFPNMREKGRAAVF